jgi:hypothetical protein
MNIEASHISDVGVVEVLHIIGSHPVTLPIFDPTETASGEYTPAFCFGPHVRVFLGQSDADKGIQRVSHPVVLCFSSIPAWREELETEALRAYVAELQSYQLQMSAVRHTDVHLKDRLVQSFSETILMMSSCFWIKRLQIIETQSEEGFGVAVLFLEKKISHAAINRRVPYWFLLQERWKFPL